MKIIAAAIRLNGINFTGRRHLQIARYLSELGIVPLGEKGFIDESGTFHDRLEAAEIALSAGQIKDRPDRTRGLDSSDIFP